MVAQTNPLGAAQTNPLLSQSAQLDQTQFLKLLTAQLQNQDPSNPISNQDFVTQLAQISTLGGIQTLNANFGDLLTLQQLTQGSNLVGKTIQYDPGTGAKQGTVSSVSVQNGKLQLLVGSAAVPLAQVQAVLATNPAPAS